MKAVPALLVLMNWRRPLLSSVVPSSLACVHRRRCGTHLRAGGARGTEQPSAGAAPNRPRRCASGGLPKRPGRYRTSSGPGRIMTRTSGQTKPNVPVLTTAAKDLHQLRDRGGRDLVTCNLPISSTWSPEGLS